ncbi:MAG: heat-inducible transcriptional repressor HrcA, partial [Ktedonobacterales bacterium]
AVIYGPGYASATVRNELVALEEQRLIRHQFYQVQHQLDEWVRLTASVMAQALQSAAIITPPRGLRARLRHFELLSLAETVALLVVVLDDGTVRQERLLLDLPATQEELSRLSRHFNETFRGESAARVTGWTERMGESLGPNERLVVDALARMLSELDLLTPDAFYHDGIVELLRRDEFTHAQPDRIRKVVEVLERSRFLPAIAPQVMSSEGVQVIIGSENESDGLKDMSVVVARYGAPGQVGGMLGIVGPTRMQYGRAIAVVRYMTEMLNDLLSELYGTEG